MLEDRRIAHADGNYPKKLAQLAKLDLLILDDWGLQKLNRAATQDLLELTDDQHGARSLLITRQLPIDHGYETLGEPTLADAILDRLLPHAHKILLGRIHAKKYLKLDPS